MLSKEWFSMSMMTTCCMGLLDGAGVVTESGADGAEWLPEPSKASTE